MSLMDSSGFPTFLDARYQSYLEEEMADQTDIRGEMFDMTTGDREEERMSSIGELGSWPEFGQILTYDQQYEQYNVIARTREYATAMILTRRLVDDDLSGVLDGNRFRAMARAGIVTVQEHATRLFEFIDVVDTHYYVFSEGRPIASTTHLTRTPGVPTTSGFDNIIVGPLTEVAMRAALIQGRKIRNDRGKRTNLTYDKLYVPVDLVPTANEILNTLQGLNTPFGNQNQESRERSGITRVVGLPFWSSANRWVLTNSRMEKMHQKWISRGTTDYGSMIEFDTLQIKFRGYDRHGFVVRGWRQHMVGLPS